MISFGIGVVVREVDCVYIYIEDEYRNYLLIYYDMYLYGGREVVWKSPELAFISTVFL